MTLITKADFVAVPSTDWRRSRAFYVDTLGLRSDGNNLMLHHRYAPHD